MEDSAFHHLISEAFDLFSFSCHTATLWPVFTVGRRVLSYEGHPLWRRQREAGNVVVLELARVPEERIQQRMTSAH